MTGALIVRCDADEKIGAGHAMRCLALADAWKRTGGTAAFVMRSCPAPLADRIRADGVELIRLPDDLTPDHDAGATAAHGRRASDGWLALDGYHFGTQYQRTVRRSGPPLLLVDDVAHLPRYDADVLLNPNIGAESLPYRCSADTRRLLGPRYALVRPEFLPWRGWVRPHRERARRVLVTLGGGDAGNLTEPVIAALEQTGDPVEVRILAGHASRHRPALGAAPARSLLELSVLAAVGDMAEQMAWADLAVTTAGGTAWESAFMGLPALLIEVADNQAPVARGLASQGAAIALGRADRLDGDTLAAELAKLFSDAPARRKMSERGRELVDGEGAARVVAALHQRSLRRPRRADAPASPP